MSVNEDDNTFRPELEEPSAALLAEAWEIIGESPEIRETAVKTLTDMIHERGEVSPEKLDEAHLVRFLRATCFDVQRSHQVMVNYYNFKRDNEQFVKNMNIWDVKLQRIFEEGIITFLPYRDQRGHRIKIIKIRKWNPSTTTIEELLKATLLILDLAVLEQRAQILGALCFFDMGGLTLRQACQITPKIVNHIMMLMGKGFPIRLQEIHILNQPTIFNMLFTMFKPFLDARIHSKIHFHGHERQSLHSLISPKHLPEEYGGYRPHIPFHQWFTNVLSTPAIVSELDRLGYITKKA